MSSKRPHLLENVHNQIHAGPPNPAAASVQKDVMQDPPGAGHLPNLKHVAGHTTLLTKDTPAHLLCQKAHTHQTLAPLSSQGTLRPTVERIENQFREGEDSDTEHNQRKKEERKRGKVLILTTGICILLPPGPESPPLPFQ